MIDLQSLSISILVVSMLFSTGLKLAPGDLLLIFSNKLATVTALLFNLVLFPFIVYRIGIELNLSLPVMTGLTLLAAAPGGPTGPVFAGIARGHLGYAAGLMVFLSFISVFSAPATVVLILKKSLPNGIFISLLLKLVMFQLLPLLAGMGLRNYQKATAEKIYNPVSKFANIMLLAVIVGLLATKGSQLFEVKLLTHGIMIGLVFAGLLSGFLTIAKWDIRRSISQVTAVRNISVGLLLSAGSFTDSATATTILTFGFYTMTIPFLFGLAQKKFTRLNRGFQGIQ